MHDSRLFPSGMRFPQIGDTRIIANTDHMADWLAGMFDTFEQEREKEPVTPYDELPDKSCEMQQRLVRIERILRNGLPHDDKDIAGTIAHAHAETELALKMIHMDGWQQ